MSARFERMQAMLSLEAVRYHVLPLETVQNFSYTVKHHLYQNLKAVIRDFQKFPLFLLGIYFDKRSFLPHTLSSSGYQAVRKLIFDFVVDEHSIDPAIHTLGQILTSHSFSNTYFCTTSEQSSVCSLSSTILFEDEVGKNNRKRKLESCIDSPLCLPELEALVLPEA